MLAMNLKSKLEEIDKSIEGVMGAAFKNLDTGEEILWNGDKPFYFASVVKIPILVELFRQIDKGKIDLDDKLEMGKSTVVPGSGVLKLLTPGLEMTVRDLTTLMMVISDNTATDMILDLVGKERVKTTMRELGLERTEIRTSIRDLLFDLVGLKAVEPEDRTVDLYRDMTKPDKVKELKRGKTSEIDNYTTPREMMFLLEKIYKKEAASGQSCEKMIDIMKNCQTGYNRILKYLPREKVEVAHKTGSLRDVKNDVGIVFPEEKSPYIICVFTKDQIDSTAGEEAIAEASKAAYEYMG
jgi:beta-lactamase class A